MSNTKQVVFTALMLSSTALGGCGLYVPEKDIFKDDTPDARGVTSGGDFESKIIGHIYCEIRQGLWEIYLNENLKPTLSWLMKWGATVTLKIQVQDMSGLNPGVSFNTPFPNSIRTFPLAGSSVTLPQSFALGLGLTGTASAQRAETIAYTYTFEDVMADAQKQSKNGHDPKTQCATDQNGVMIDSDLKIAQFMYDKALVAQLGNTGNPPNKPPYTTFTDDITFVASYGGQATPTWTFARLATDPSSGLANGKPLLNALRTSTNDVLITLGAVATPAKVGQAGQLVPQAQLVHNTGLTGGATATAITGQKANQ